MESPLPSFLPPNRPPRSTPPISHDHRQQVHFHTPSVTASECISILDRSRPASASSEFTWSQLPNASPKLARSWPPSASPNLIDHGLQVHTIMATNCISTHAQSQPRSASPNLINHGLQVHLLSSLNLSLQVHLQTRSIATSKCISKLDRPRPASWQDDGLRLPSACRNSHGHPLRVHLPTRSITASNCISSVHSITASKWISKLAQSPPPSASPNLDRSQPRSASLSSLHPGLELHLQTWSITASKDMYEHNGFWTPSISLRSDSACMEIQGWRRRNERRRVYIWGTRGR